MELALRCAVRYSARHAWPTSGSSGRAFCDVLQRQFRPAAASSLRVTGLRSFAASAGDAPTISAAQVKELRTRTGASMGKCRQALIEENGNLEEAVTWLRKRGIRSMERRTNDAAESMLAVCTTSEGGAIVEIQAETDFVTKSALFQSFAMSVANTAAAKGSAGDSSELGEAAFATSDSELSGKLSAGASVEAALLELGSVLGERLMLGQSQHIAVPSSGAVAGYAHPKHAGAAAGTGRMAALVSVSSSPGSTEAADGLNRIASQLARHIVAAQPRFVSIERVCPDVLKKEQSTMREAYLQELDEKRKANLTEAVLTKVLEGKTKKFYQESVLLQQEIILPTAGETDAKQPTVEKWLKQEAKSIGVEAVTVDDLRLVVV